MKAFQSQPRSLGKQETSQHRELSARFISDEKNVSAARCTRSSRRKGAIYFDISNSSYSDPSRENNTTVIVVAHLIRPYCSRIESSTLSERDFVSSHRYLRTFISREQASRIAFNRSLFLILTQNIRNVQFATRTLSV